MTFIKPKKLKQGDTIGIVAPSGFWEREEIDKAAADLAAFGFTVRVHPQCYERDFVSAGPVEHRLAGLHEFFADDVIDAIFALRGGLRGMQLLDRIDYALIARHPKIFIGYSDVTFLLSALNKRAGLVTFHGLTLSRYLSDKPRDDQEKTLAFLQGGDFPWDEAGETLRPGEAEGVLFGGTFGLVVALLTAKESLRPDLKGKILLIEDIGEEIRQIDRLMEMLKLSGAFDCLEGLIVGQMTDIGDTGGYYKFNCSARDLILQHVGDWDKPVVFNAPFGHAAPNLPFPIGIKARLTAQADGKTALRLLESPFADA